MPLQQLASGKKLADHIRARFIDWYKKSGLSQEQAGEPIEWSQQTVSQYFNGEQTIDLVRVIAWCKFFGYELTDLIEDGPVQPADPRIVELVQGFNRQSEPVQNAVLGLVGAIGQQRVSSQAKRRAPAARRRG